MPRNVSGVYSLPAGNPVVTGTIITSTWANSTMTDLATGITESLDRQGRGGMTGALRAADGTVALPGLAFVNETSTGISRPASNVLAFSVAGAERGRLTSSAFGIGVTPTVAFHVGGSNILEARLESTGNLTTSTPVSLLRFAGSNGLSGYVGFGGVASTLDVVNTLNGPVRFFANNTEWMRINAAGSIGIGVTATPGATLDIAVAGADSSIRLQRAGFSNATIQGVQNAMVFGCDGGSGTTERMRITSGGAVSFVSIGTTASGANAFLDSGASNNLLRSTSSRRYKIDIRDLPETGVLTLRPVVYKSNAEADDKSLDWYGLIAEEVAEVNPRLCHYIEIDGERVPDGVQYDRVGVLLLAEVKKLAARVAALEP